MAQPLMLVTGGSRGIGAATVLLAASRGWRVAFSYKDNAEAANMVVAKAKSLGADVIALQADVSNESDVVLLFETVEQKLGARSALINNAGMLEQQMLLDLMDLGRWQWVFSANVFGSCLCAKQAVIRLATKHGGKGGLILNVCVGGARRGCGGVEEGRMSGLAGGDAGYHAARDEGAGGADLGVPAGWAGSRWLRRRKRRRGWGRRGPAAVGRSVCKAEGATPVTSAT